MTIGKVAIGIILALAISPLIVYLSLPSYSTSAASIPVVNNLVVVADDAYVTRVGVDELSMTEAGSTETYDEDDIDTYYGEGGGDNGGGEERLPTR